MSELNVGDLNVGQYLNLPVYPESGLPAGVPVGHMVFNSTKGKIVVWNGLLWVAIGSKKYAMTATGSVTSSDLSGDFNGYKVLKFTGNGSLNVISAPDDSGIELLLIAGGGGGGGVIGGGGGAGGVIYKRSLYLPQGVYNITIGQGGEGGRGWNVADQEGRAGTPTVLSGGDIFYEAIGGGGGCAHGGASVNAFAGSGGSGGGGAATYRQGGGTIGLQCGHLAAQIKTDYPMTYSTPRHNNKLDAQAKDIDGNLFFASVRAYQVGNDTGGDAQHPSSRTTLHPGPHIIRHTQGYSGGSFGDGNLGAGGGGAGGFGQAAGPPRGVAGDGGVGAYFDIEGTKKAYAGGGGGGVRGTGRIRGIGGVGGGGNGGRNTLAPTPYSSSTADAASNGQDNTGGGGGGGGYNGPTPGVVAGNGGPGILIIRYKAN